MMLHRQRFAAFLAFSLSIFLAACGAPGPPLPPSLELPKPVTDLHATRKGEKVYLSWTVPAQTMDYQAVRHLGPTRICRTLEVAANQCVSVGEVPPPQLPKVSHERGRKPKAAGPAVQASYTDLLPADLLQQHPTAVAYYAVETLNGRGRSAGLSNQVPIPLAPTLSAPAALHARVTGEGVVLNWIGTLPPREFNEISYVYRIYRRVKGENTDAIAGEVPASNSPEATFVDHAFEWQKTYEYRVAPVTVIAIPGEPPTQVEGDDSPPVEVFANDVFPPGVPNGVQAVASGVGQQPFIDLTWAPNTESDLAGYNIYRREENGQSSKINRELVKTPAYRDNSVQPGKKYFYSVSAVDLRGNESDRSEETSEVLP
jgi:hypothetical protein